MFFLSSQVQIWKEKNPDNTNSFLRFYQDRTRHLKERRLKVLSTVQFRLILLWQNQTLQQKLISIHTTGICPVKDPGQDKTHKQNTMLLHENKLWHEANWPHCWNKHIKLQLVSDPKLDLWRVK